MGNTYFRFKEFTVVQEHSAMKVTTDACAFGAWISQAIKPSKPIVMLDIGAGTGLLSLMVRQKHQLTVDAIELDAGAAEECRSNFSASPWSQDLIVYQDDARHFKKGTYPLIVSNPPFFENDLKSPDDRRSLAHHGGLSFKELSMILSNLIAPDGEFFLMIPYRRLLEIRTELSGSGLFINEMITLNHRPEKEPIRIFIRGSRLERQPTVEDLPIKNRDGNYSTRFRQLLKDYYLYL